MPCRQVLHTRFVGCRKSRREIIKLFFPRRGTNPRIEPELVLIQLDDSRTAFEFAVRIRPRDPSESQGDVVLDPDKIVVMIMPGKYPHDVPHLNQRSKKSRIDFGRSVPFSFRPERRMASFHVIVLGERDMKESQRGQRHASVRLRIMSARLPVPFDLIETNPIVMPVFRLRGIVVRIEAIEQRGNIGRLRVQNG